MDFRYGNISLRCYYLFVDSEGFKSNRKGFYKTAETAMLQGTLFKYIIWHETTINFTI